MRATRRAIVAVAVATAMSFIGVESAGTATRPTNSITSVTVAPTGTDSGYCTYSLAVAVTHVGPVHIDALATDGTTNYGGGNTDLRGGKGAYTFTQTVWLPPGVTATFFGALYRHHGPNAQMLAYDEAAGTHTCA